MKVTRPYFDKGNGRWRVHIYDEVTGKWTTKWYARYLMEQHLGRTLESWEEVDHINEDKTDDRVENLQVITHPENMRKYNRLRNLTKWYEFTCPECGKEARKEYRLYKRDQLIRGNDGPYCSRSCKAKAISRKRASKKWYDFTCPECGNEARKEYRQYKQDQLIRGNDGPYCSSSCRSKATWRKRRANKVGGTK